MTLYRLVVIPTPACLVEKNSMIVVCLLENKRGHKADSDDLVDYFDYKMDGSVNGHMIALSVVIQTVQA
jgi:hypothetical protein